MSGGWPGDVDASPRPDQLGSAGLDGLEHRTEGAERKVRRRRPRGGREPLGGQQSAAGGSPEPEAMPPGDPEQVARLILLRRLEAGPRTRAELAKTLRERGVPDDVAARVLDRFVEVGLIDDPLFAQMWVQSRQPGRLLSRRALRQELVRRGVASESIEAAVCKVSDEQELDAARQLAERKARSTVGLAHPVRVRRLVGALARRGYSAGLVHAVVLEVLAGGDEADGDQASEGQGGEEQAGEAWESRLD